MPCGVAGLEDDVPRHTVIADDKGNMAFAGCRVLTDKLCYIHAGDRRRGDGPRDGDGPVGGIVQTDRRITVRLRRLDRRGVLLNGRYETSAGAAVIAKAIDVDPVVRRIGIDLEADLASTIDADAGGEAFDISGRRTAEVPYFLRGAGVLVFDNDRIWCHSLASLLWET